MSESIEKGLYSLNKDMLIKIICTINADKDKKYNHLLEQIKELGEECLTCDICEYTDIVQFGSEELPIMCCQKCKKIYHIECKPICYSCDLCSSCNPIDYIFDYDCYRCKTCNKDFL